MTQNGLILVDKPFQWTAFDCVTALKTALRVNTIGHMGTLDPQARTLPQAPCLSVTIPTAATPNRPLFQVLLTLRTDSGWLPLLLVQATGLLAIGLGAATKLSASFSQLDKTYAGVIRLGAATDTGDAGGSVTEHLPWSHVTDDAIQQATEKFRGEIMQEGADGEV